MPTTGANSYERTQVTCARRLVLRYPGSFGTARIAEQFMPVEGGTRDMRDVEEYGSAELQPPLRRATGKDARALAELIEYAGDGIPGYLWSQSAKEGQPPIEVGIERVLRE